MRFTGSRWVAGTEVLALLLVAGCAIRSNAAASTRPEYGGTLRVELSAPTVNLDPRQWKEGTAESGENERIAELVYERLLALDNYGRFQPRLATDWNHDGTFKRWQFTIRSGVKFSDGSLLTASDVAGALQPLLPPELKISYSASSVFIQDSLPAADLPALLASGRFFVYRAAADGTLLGTGPFTFAGVTSGGIPDGSGAADPAKPRKLKFQAAEQYWAGRPFVNSIEINLGVPPLRALFDVQLGKADIALLTPDTVRRAEQSNLRVWKSFPLTLYAVQFEEPQKQHSDEKLREALSLSLDRATMAGVLLQKQAEPAGALLPQWLSGYAFLFEMETNLERARELRSALPAGSIGRAAPLRLQVSLSGDLPKLLGERVVVNARQAGLSMQLEVQPRSPSEGRDPLGSRKDTADQATAQLLAWRTTLLSPRWELSAMIDLLQPENGEMPQPMQDVGQLYEQERALLDTKEILPLVDLPDYVALSPAVRDWLPTLWGEWNLADVWLDRGEKTPANSPDAAVPKAFCGAHP
jgi:peptide/nickel transport system substrate-binding protein